MSKLEDEFDEGDKTPSEHPPLLANPHEPELVRALIDLAARYASSQLALMDLAKKLGTGRVAWSHRVHNEIDKEIRIGLREIHTMLDRLPAPGHASTPTPMPPADEEP